MPQGLFFFGATRIARRQKLYFYYLFNLPFPLPTARRKTNKFINSVRAKLLYINDTMLQGFINATKHNTRDRKFYRLRTIKP